MLEPLGHEEQLKLWEGRAKDVRPSVGTGVPDIDVKLFRNGFQPGTFIILGGRTHTRKTGIALNLIATWLRQGRNVGLVGLDEPIPAYVAKLCSVLTGESLDLGAEWLEENWNEKEAEAARDAYTGATEGRFVMTRGFRPSFKALQHWLDDADSISARPDVVVIDYLALLARGKYSGSETSRIPRLAEDLAVWTNENALVTIVLHQVGRMDDGKGKRYHGDTPMTLEGLKYGGEEMADVVLATYAPALNYLGNLSEEDAEEEYSDDEKWRERWEKARDRVQRYQDSVFVQLLKNRPSQKGLHIRGVELIAPGASMYMRQVRETDLEQHEEYEQESRRAASG